MTAKLSIVQKVLALLNITEEGKIENFFMKQRNILNKDIKNLNKNLDTIKDQFEEQLEDLNEKLQDAETVVEEAYTSIKVENIDTNEKANQFADVYWGRIENAEEKVSYIKKQIEDLEKQHVERVESIDKQVSERQRRLEKIS